MVEHAVEHDTNSSLVRCIEHRIECFVSPQQGVDREVVVRVIPMVRRALKDRIEPDGVEPEIYKMVQPIDDAPEITTLVAPDGGRSIPCIETNPVVDPPGACEAVRKDLIEDRTTF